MNRKFKWYSALLLAWISMLGLSCLNLYAQPSVAVTITTVPAGLTISVDGTNYITPANFCWLSASSHTLIAASPQTAADGHSRNIFASWSDGGMVVSDLVVGNRLCAGTASLDGESAFMTLRFDDGTCVTLAGETVLEFDARWQKTLVLRRGNLSVDAHPQPRGRPMLIRTPTAEVEVVGTVFSVSVDPQHTHLAQT
jgi:hypothetical protein